MCGLTAPFSQLRRACRHRSRLKRHSKSRSHAREARVVRPQPRVRSESARRQQLRIDIADTRSIERLRLDHPQDLPICRDRRLWETTEKSEDLLAVAQVAKRKLSRDPWVGEDRAILKHARQRALPRAPPSDPDHLKLRVGAGHRAVVVVLRYHREAVLDRRRSDQGVGELDRAVDARAAAS